MREELSDGHVRIRRYAADDVDALFDAATASIPEVSKWLPWCHPGYAREESAEWVGSRPAAWERREAYSFAIEDAATGEFLGGCGLNQIDPLNKSANLGYWVKTGRTGEGVATAAARLAATLGFEDLALQRIEILAAAGNTASQRVAEKLGAAREGTLRRRFLLQGGPQDGVLYSLIREDLL